MEYSVINSSQRTFDLCFLTLNLITVFLAFLSLCPQQFLTAQRRRSIVFSLYPAYFN